MEDNRDELDIFERCGKHAQTMKKMGEIIVEQQASKQRQDGFDKRLSDLEKTNKQLDRIEGMLIKALKK